MKRLAYAIGFRPGPSSRFFSPHLCVHYYFRDCKKARERRDAMVVLIAKNPNVGNLLRDGLKQRDQRNEWEL